MAKPVNQPHLVGSFHFLKGQVRSDNARKHTVVPFCEDGIHLAPHPSHICVLAPKVVHHEKLGGADALFEADAISLFMA